MKLEDKVQWLFDVEQIKQLKYRYCSFCDDQYNPDGLASLFSEGGVWDGGKFGLAEGREAIRDFFAGASGRTVFANHYATNPIISIDGDSASGHWDLWQPMVRGPDPTAMWLMAKYKERYVRAGEGWLIDRLQLEILALSPYAQGFAEQRFIDGF